MYRIQNTAEHKSLSAVGHIVNIPQSSVEGKTATREDEMYPIPFKILVSNPKVLAFRYLMRSGISFRILTIVSFCLLRVCSMVLTMS